MNINQAMIKSAIRHFALVTIATYEAGAKDWKSLVWGVAAAILGPSLRAWDKKDPAFGRIVSDIDKLLKADKTK